MYWEIQLVSTATNLTTDNVIYHIFCHPHVSHVIVFSSNFPCVTKDHLKRVKTTGSIQMSTKLDLESWSKFWTFNYKDVHTFCVFTLIQDGQWIQNHHGKLCSY